MEYFILFDTERVASTWICIRMAALRLMSFAMTFMAGQDALFTSCAFPSEHIPARIWVKSPVYTLKSLQKSSPNYQELHDIVRSIRIEQYIAALDASIPSWLYENMSHSATGPNIHIDIIL